MLTPQAGGCGCRHDVLSLDGLTILSAFAHLCQELPDEGHDQICSVDGINMVETREHDKGRVWHMLGAVHDKGMPVIISADIQQTRERHTTWCYTSVATPTSQRNHGDESIQVVDCCMARSSGVHHLA